jgi:hypothetical protein
MEIASFHVVPKTNTTTGLNGIYMNSTICGRSVVQIVMRIIKAATTLSR